MPIFGDAYFHLTPAVNVASLTPRVEDGTILRRFKDRCTKISHAYIFGLLNYRQDTEHESLLPGEC